MWKRRGLVIWMRYWCMKLTTHLFETGQSKFLMTYCKCLILVVLLRSFPQLPLQPCTVILSNRNDEKSFRLSHYACSKPKRTDVWPGFPPTTLTVKAVGIGVHRTPQPISILMLAKNQCSLVKNHQWWFFLFCWRSQSACSSEGLEWRRTVEQSKRAPGKTSVLCMGRSCWVGSLCSRTCCMLMYSSSSYLNGKKCWGVLKPRNRSRYPGGPFLFWCSEHHCGLREVRKSIWGEKCLWHWPYTYNHSHSCKYYCHLCLLCDHALHSTTRRCPSCRLLHGPGKPRLFGSAFMWKSTSKVEAGSAVCAMNRPVTSQQQCSMSGIKTPWAGQGSPLEMEHAGNRAWPKLHFCHGVSARCPMGWRSAMEN